MPVPENAIHYVEIVTPEVDAAVELYASSFGWKFEPAVPELGNARVATLPDGSLCGIRAPMHEQEEPVVRNYMHVDDVDRAVTTAEQHGAMLALLGLLIAFSDADRGYS